MRNPVSVAKQIRDFVPFDLKGQFKETAREDLGWYIEDFSYKPPENWTDCFARLQNYLWEHLWNESGYLPEEWQMQVASIMSTRSMEEIRRLNEEEYKHRVKYELKKKA